MTDANSLDLTRFQELLDVHGAELARWPEPLQAAARELLAASPSARQAHEQALGLAALLDEAPEILPSAELSARLAALPARQPRGWAAWWPFGNPVAPLMGWAAAAAFGLVVGSSSLPLWDAPAEQAEVSAEVEGSPAQGAALGAESGVAEVDPPAANVDDAAAGEEDWNDLELALGIGLEWEDEP